MFSDWEEARRLAVKQLKSRPRDEFVPALVDSMDAPHTDSSSSGMRLDEAGVPKQDSYRQTQGVNGKIPSAAECSSIRCWEGWADGNLYAPNGMVNGWWGCTPAVIERGPLEAPVRWTFTYWFGASNCRNCRGYPGCPITFIQHGLTPEEATSARTALAAEINQRIAYALNETAGQTPSSDSKVPPSVQDEHPETSGTQSSAAASAHRQQRPLLSCLAAGTWVWTIEGPRHIERIAVGDLLLAQNVKTGELAYKPVLGAMIGPAGDLLALKAGEDTIHCTGGCAFWVPSHGWTHAHKLDSQSRMHGVSGAATIDSVGPGPKEKTCNLVVADWNTYFVGRGKLLIHDVTLPGPTTTDLPGLNTP